MAAALIAACGDGSGDSSARQDEASSNASTAEVEERLAEWRELVGAGSYAEAATHARGTLNDHPRSALAHYMVSASAWYTNDRATVLAEAREAVRLDSTDARFVEMLALGYQSHMRLDSAELYWARLTRLRPDDPGAWLDLGRIAHANGNWLRADSAFYMLDSLAPMHFDTAPFDGRMMLENRVEIRRALGDAAAPQWVPRAFAAASRRDSAGAP